MLIFRILAMMVGMISPAAALALSCEITPFDEIAVHADTTDAMMVMGVVDADFVFDGIIASSGAPVQLQMTSQFRDPPHPVWGGPTLPTNLPVLGPVVRVDSTTFQFIGGMCGMLLINGNEENLAWVRQCQRDGVCPE